MKMESYYTHSRQSRREFLRNAALLGSFLRLDPGRLFARTDPGDEKRETFSRFSYKYKTLSVDRFGELQEDIDGLKQGGALGRNQTFQGYLKNMKFTVPDNFREAQSVIILSVFTQSMVVPFHLNGKTHEILIPPQYYDDGVTKDDLKNAIKNDILPKSGCRIEPAAGVHLKLLAVRSGLGKYGRNNVCYVDGMGSYAALYAFFTDHPFAGNDWRPIGMMDACKRCVMCYGICPTGAIRKDPFVIDAGRCVTLYNEIEGPFPKWIRPGAHDALMGCMKCQKHCPENAKVAQSSGRLEDVTEEETRKILNGTPDDALIQSLKRKLRDFYPAASKEAFPLLTRNLGVLIKE
jgi:epoxyqueuosine reductase